MSDIFTSDQNNAFDVAGVVVLPNVPPKPVYIPRPDITAFGMEFHAFPLAKAAAALELPTPDAALWPMLAIPPRDCIC
jgi:hypothetical protein